MVNYWQPGIQYDVGDVVEFNDARYRVIQSHFSQSNWEPGSSTAALWGRIPEDQHEHHYEPHHEHQQPLVNLPRKSSQEFGHQSSEKKWDQHSEQQVNIPHEEHKKPWYDLSDERKKQLEIGGGLVAGLAALGAGYYAYNKHEDSQEKQKANVWALQSWLADAKARTQDYYRDGPRGPLAWILIEGHDIPKNALVAGEEGGKHLYFSRAFCDGGIQVGKAGLHLKKGAVYGYKNKTYEVGTYEILVGDSRAMKWVHTGGALRLDELGARAVEGGKENDGTPIYLAKVEHHGYHPGKASTVLDGAYIAYGDQEKKVKEYSVLCYA